MEEADFFIFSLLFGFALVFGFVIFYQLLDALTRLYLILALIGYFAGFGAIFYFRSKAFGGAKEYLLYIARVHRAREERREHLKELEEEARAIGKGLGISEQKPTNIIIKNVIMTTKKPEEKMPDISKLSLDVPLDSLGVPKKKKKFDIRKYL